MSRIRVAGYLLKLGRVEECERMCRQILDDPIHPYNRMSTLILLYRLCEDWKEKEDLRIRAQAICTSIRRMSPPGIFKHINGVLSAEQIDALLSVAEKRLQEMAREQAENRPGPDERVVAWIKKNLDSIRVYSTRAYTLP